MSSTITALTSGGGLAMAGDTSGQLELKTNNGTTAITIDTSQNVGIGTSSPSGKLHVKGGNNNSLYIDNGGTQYTSAYWFNNGTQKAGVYWDNTNTLYYIDNQTANGQNIYNAGSSGTHRFTINSTEAMRIDSSGRLLVNRTTANAQMCLNYAGSSIEGFSINDSASSSGSAAVRFQFGGTGVGGITLTGSTTSYNTSSDYRLKENIAPMTGALNTIAQLKPVTYNWKSNGTSGQGFIAHELQEVVPDCVIGEKDAVNEDGSIKAQGIDTSFLVATLTKAIQEQQTLIESLTTRLTALEAK